MRAEGLWVSCLVSLVCEYEYEYTTEYKSNTIPDCCSFSLVRHRYEECWYYWCCVRASYSHPDSHGRISQTVLIASIRAEELRV